MIEIGFLISILSASNFIHTPRNQIFHFQILKLHFHTEDTGGGGEGTIHHFSSLSRSASSGICQKTKSSALLIYARAATSTLNPGRQLSPAELPYPDIPWHRISSGRGGGGGHTQATSSALHLSLAARTKHYGMYGGRLRLRLSAASLLQHQACAGAQLSPVPPHSVARPNPSPSRGLASCKVCMCRGWGLKISLSLSQQPIANWPDT